MTMTTECEYCGQQVLVQDENTPGWAVCRCSAAKIRQNYESVVLEGNELIEEIFDAPEEECGFSPAGDHVLDVLRILLREVAQRAIGTVTVALTDGSKAAMRINGNGDLEISRSRRNKLSHTTTQH